MFIKRNRMTKLYLGEEKYKIIKLHQRHARRYILIGNRNQTILGHVEELE